MDEVRTDLALLARLAWAAALGGVLGWERLTAGKSAGVRTLMLVSLASALFVAVSALSVAEAHEVTDRLETDPVRIVQAVAIGIGFLGAGTVYAERARGRVHGLTTAASIWATAAVGIAAGLGRVALSLGATLLILGILRGLARFEPDRT